MRIVLKLQVAVLVLAMLVAVACGQPEPPPLPAFEPGATIFPAVQTDVPTQTPVGTSNVEEMVETVAKATSEAQPTQDDIPTPEPNLQATVQAMVRAALPTTTPTSTPDVVATIEAGVAATVEAIPTDTPTVTSTPSSTATHTPTVTYTPNPTITSTPSPIPTVTQAPTATHVPTRTAIPTPTLAQMIRQIEPGLVQIVTSVSGGSGFVIDEYGLVATNEHVVGDSPEVTVRFVDGREYRGSVLGKDGRADLALVQIITNDQFTPMVLGDSDGIQVGDDVIALGFPLGDRIGRDPTITRGILSSVRHFQDVEHLQTDAAINPGNSGGPLVNRSGRVVGVNTSKIDETNTGRPVDNIGFAVAVNDLKDRLSALRQRGFTRRNTPTPSRTAARTPTPIPTRWETHQNGIYGYSIDIAAGWNLDEKKSSDRYSSFWSADKTAIFSIVSHELGENYSLKELAEWRRDSLEEMANEEAWNVFDITYFQKRRENGREFYRLVYRSQTSDEYCVSSRIEIIFLSAWYPEKPYGFRLIANVCERSVSEYAQARDTMVNSFTEWDIYHNSTYDYSIDIAPGWELDEEEKTDDYAVFWANDKKAILSIRSYELGANYSLKELADWRRDSLEESAKDERWNVLEITSFQKRQENGREFYWITYRYQSSDEFCISNRSELVALSSWYPLTPYGFSVAGGVCEDNINDLGEERDGMLVNFRF